MLDTPKADLVRILAEDPSALFERVAKEQNVTLREVILALPHEMRSIASGERFIDAMKEVATWGEVTVIIHTDDGIMEFTGPVPNGEVGRGYYNLMSRTGFHGHLRRVEVRLAGAQVDEVGPARAQLADAPRQPQRGGLLDATHPSGQVHAYDGIRIA